MAVGLFGKGNHRPRPHRAVPGERGLQVLCRLGVAAGDSRQHAEPVVGGAEEGSHSQRAVLPGVRGGEFVQHVRPLPVSDQVDGAGEAGYHGPPPVVLVRAGRGGRSHPAKQFGRLVHRTRLGQAPRHHGRPGDVPRLVGGKLPQHRQVPRPESPQQPPRDRLRRGNHLRLRVPDARQPAAKLAGQLLGLKKPALQVGDGNVPHRRQPHELRVPYLFRQFLHDERGPGGGGLLSALELRGYPDPEPLKPQLVVAEFGPDAEDLAGHREGIGDVVWPVERPVPVHQDGGERPPVFGRARHRHRPLAERQPLRVRPRVVQPVRQPGEDGGPGGAVALA